MKTVLVLILFALLTGCAGWSTFQAGAAMNSAHVADETLITAQWTLCKAITVGAWQRAYGADPVRREGWQKLCSAQAAAPSPLLSIESTQGATP